LSGGHQIAGGRPMGMTTFINKIFRLWTPRINVILGVFLTSTMKTSIAKSHESFSKMSSKTFINIFQWIPSLLINPASLFLLTIAGFVYVVIPFFKKAWQMIQIG
jgi:hypothetical protein